MILVLWDYNTIPEMEQLTNNRGRNLFLTVMEAEKSMIKVVTDSVSIKSLLPSS